MVKFGASCDQCGLVRNNYSTEDIYSCADCGMDLCAVCRWVTGHELVGDVCCEECSTITASCALEAR
jgi:hypothetical protein